MNDTTINQSEVINTDDNYIHFAEAERLGTALATRETYRDCDWAELEVEAQRLWEETHDRPWSEFKEIVRQAWAEVQSQSSTKDTPEDAMAYHNLFSRHYETHYAGSHYGYEQYAPAYHYGYDLAVDGRLSGASWADIEPRAGQFWQSHSFGGPWKDFKPAVHYAWSETKKRIA